MARAYRQDLRDRVIDAALGGMPARRAAVQFEFGVATAIVPGAMGAVKERTPSEAAQQATR
jgi:hypothetical protein